MHVTRVRNPGSTGESTGPVAISGVKRNKWQSVTSHKFRIYRAKFMTAKHMTRNKLRFRSRTPFWKIDSCPLLMIYLTGHKFRVPPDANYTYRYFTRKVWWNRKISLACWLAGQNSSKLIVNVGKCTTDGTHTALPFISQNCLSDCFRKAKIFVIYCSRDHAPLQYTN